MSDLRRRERIGMSVFRLQQVVSWSHYLASRERHQHRVRHDRHQTLTGSACRHWRAAPALGNTRQARGVDRTPSTVADAPPRSCSRPRRAATSCSCNAATALRPVSLSIALRRENGVSEMDILSHMIRSHVPGVNVNFPEMAALSAVFLVAGDR